MINYKSMNINRTIINENYYQQINQHQLYLVLFCYFLYIYMLRYFFNNNNANDDVSDDTDSDVEELHESSKINILYENKYLEEFKKLDNEILFSETELLNEIEQKFIIEKKLNNDLEIEKNEIKNKITQLNEKYLEFEIYKEEENNDDCEEEKESEEDYDEEEEDYYDISSLLVNNIDKINIKKELIQLINNQDILNTKIIEESEIDKLANEFILNEHLDNLKNCIIMEKTPVGNVIMFYNNSRSSFEYYSDNTIPYRYLEVIGRKYVITYKCKNIFVDMEEEIKDAEQKLEQKKQKIQEFERNNKINQDINILNNNNNLQVSVPVKNVFAKFKKYNNNNSISVASVPTDHSTNSKQTKPQEDKIVKEHSNRYSFEGKIANFNFLKKVDRKIIDKRYAMSFSEFKKMQKK